MKIKYVVFNEQNAVLVPCTLYHSDVSGPGKATSAGFCAFKWSPDDCKWKADVWGESTSLKLKSKPDDVRCVEFLLNN